MRRYGDALWVAATLAGAAVIVAAVLAYTSLHGPGTGSAAVGQRPQPARYYDWPGGVPPIGITFSSLEDYILRKAVITQLDQQIRAARDDWYANTVRLQITQDRLVPPSGGVSMKYLADIRAVTGYALRLHLRVVLNAQTEASIGYGADEPLPTAATYRFWRLLLRYYRGNPDVVLDLFNEPRKCGWPAWRHSMQNLISFIRYRLRASNPVWVEGLWWGDTLTGATWLHGGGITYTFHHPGSPWPGQAPVTVATWDHAFGDLAARGFPVVDGEFANYEGSYYWGPPDLPGGSSLRLVRRYLQYLTAHHIGMLAWSLIPGALNRTLSYASESSEPEGDGRLVHAWFQQESRGRQ